MTQPDQTNPADRIVDELIFMFLVFPLFLLLIVFVMVNDTANAFVTNNKVFEILPASSQRETAEKQATQNAEGTAQYAATVAAYTSKVAAVEKALLVRYEATFAVSGKGVYPPGDGSAFRSDGPVLNSLKESVLVKLPSGAQSCTVAIGNTITEITLVCQGVEPPRFR